MNTAPSGANKSALKKMDFSAILEQLVTVDQANCLVIDLEKLLDSLYLTKTIDVRYYQSLSDLLARNDKKACLEKLIAVIKKLPVININLSFYPNFELAEKMSHWLEEVLGEKVLISVKNKQELFTKIEIEYKGKYGKF